MTPSRAQIVTCEFGLCLCLILSLPSRGPSAVTQLLDVSAQFRHASQHVLEKIRQLRLIFFRDPSCLQVEVVVFKSFAATESRTQ